MLRQLRHQEWLCDFFTRDDDVIEALLGHDLLEQVDDFLDVLLVEIVSPALVTRLRPSTYLRSARFLILHGLLSCLGAECEDEQARAIGIDEQGRVSRVLVVHPRERVQVRNGIQMQGRLVYGHVERDRLEEITRRRRK